MLLATIDSGTLIIALPELERALDTGLLELVWVILAWSGLAGRIEVNVHSSAL